MTERGTVGRTAHHQGYVIVDADAGDQLMLHVSNLGQIELSDLATGTTIEFSRRQRRGKPGDEAFDVSIVAPDRFPQTANETGVIDWHNRQVYGEIDAPAGPAFFHRDFVGPHFATHHIADGVLVIFERRPSTKRPGTSEAHHLMRVADLADPDVLIDAIRGQHHQPQHRIADGYARQLSSLIDDDDTLAALAAEFISTDQLPLGEAILKRTPRLASHPNIRPHLADDDFALIVRQGTTVEDDEAWDRVLNWSGSADRLRLLLDHIDLDDRVRANFANLSSDVHGALPDRLITPALVLANPTNYTPTTRIIVGLAATDPTDAATILEPLVETIIASPHHSDVRRRTIADNLQLIAPALACLLPSPDFENHLSSLPVDEAAVLLGRRLRHHQDDTLTHRLLNDALLLACPPADTITPAARIVPLLTTNQPAGFTDRLRAITIDDRQPDDPLPADILTIDGIFDGLDPTVVVKATAHLLTSHPVDTFNRLDNDAQLIAVAMSTYQQRALPDTLTGRTPIVDIALATNRGHSLVDVHRQIEAHLHNTVPHLADDEPATLGSLLPSCTGDATVLWCEGRPWPTHEATYPPAWCPRTRKACDTVTPYRTDDDNPAAPRYPGKGHARLQPMIGRGPIRWSLQLRHWTLHEHLHHAGTFIEGVEGLDTSHLDAGYLVYVNQLAGWLNRINDLRHRTRCSGCDTTMANDYRYARNWAPYRTTMLQCPQPGDDHDRKVYLNHCHGCDHVIDSRESRYSFTGTTTNYAGEPINMYVCIHCASGPPGMPAGIVCPSCSTGHTLTRANGQWRTCTDCGHQIRLPSARPDRPIYNPHKHANWTPPSGQLRPTYTAHGPRRDGWLTDDRIAREQQRRHHAHHRPSGDDPDGMRETIEAALDRLDPERPTTFSDDPF